MGNTELDIIRGRFGAVSFDYRLHLSNIRGDELQLLPAWDGAFDLSNFRDETWQLSVDIRATDALDPFNDYVKLIVTATSGGRSAAWPMGLYRFRVPDEEMLETRRDWNLKGYSPEMIVMDDYPQSLYEVPAGRGVLAECRSILVGMGVPSYRIAFPPHDKALRNPYSVEPLVDAESQGRWLRIINNLLGAGSFYALTTDREGRFTTRLMEDLTTRNPDFIYGPGGDGMLIPPISNSWDDTRFGNKVVVVTEDTQEMPPMYAVAINNDPDSPASVDRIGVKAKDPIRVSATTDQAALQRLADGYLQAYSSYHRNTTFQFKADPRRCQHEVCKIAGIDIDPALGSLMDNHRVNNFSWNLKHPAEPMQMEIAKVDKIGGP